MLKVLFHNRGGQVLGIILNTGKSGPATRPGTAHDPLDGEHRDVATMPAVATRPRICRVARYRRAPRPEIVGTIIATLPLEKASMETWSLNTAARGHLAGQPQHVGRAATRDRHFVEGRRRGRRREVDRALEERRVADAPAAAWCS